MAPESRRIELVGTAQSNWEQRKAELASSADALEADVARIDKTVTP